MASSAVEIQPILRIWKQQIFRSVPSVMFFAQRREARVVIESRRAHAID